MVEEHMKALFGQELSAWVDVYVARGMWRWWRLRSAEELTLC